MSDSTLRQAVFEDLIQRVCDLYGMTATEEHPAVYEFTDGSSPVFKLIAVHSDTGPGFNMASFHIDVEAAIAIQWFLRLRELDSNMRLTACYLKDLNGVSYVGEDAHVLRMYMIEQDIMSQYVAGDKDAEDIINKANTALYKKPSPIRGYSNYKVALDQFKKLVKKEGDTEH